jgi:hypothetical protein
MASGERNCKKITYDLRSPHIGTEEAIKTLVVSVHFPGTIYTAPTPHKRLQTAPAYPQQRNILVKTSAFYHVH